MTKKVAVNSSDIANILFNYFGDSSDIEIIQTDFAQDDDSYDLVCVEGDGEIPMALASSFDVINVHYSLLPAFSGKDAVKK
jgi:folate-dependent phosphoribosylglycinamide formyltransferase PurN